MGDRDLLLMLPDDDVGDLALGAFRETGLFVGSGELLGGRALGADLIARRVASADVPVYVDHGIADLGVARTEVLYEARVGVYRPHTFSVGAHPIALIAPAGTSLAALGRRHLVRVGTGLSQYARDRFAALGWRAELIHVQGSLRTAALLGLCDAVIDVVTDVDALERDGLVVLQELGRSEIKLIVNRATNRDRMLVIEQLVAKLSGCC
jgi:ATP phosphoribosyltransferase